MRQGGPLLGQQWDSWLVRHTGFRPKGGIITDELKTARLHKRSPPEVGHSAGFEVWIWEECGSSKSILAPARESAACGKRSPPQIGTAGGGTSRFGP